MEAPCEPDRGDGRDAFSAIVGEAAAIRLAVASLRPFADADAPLLLTGETGCGKELFARAAHAASVRRHRPFVPVNCAAVPSTLFEAEFFGYRRGAFTGATRDHAGFAQQAHTGTLFLDEVAELPLDLQPKLLRLLQEHQVRPVGGTREVEVDLRLIAASNRDLAQEVRIGRFRPDLYYRLNALEIHVPSLRERIEDLPGLAAHLLARMGWPQKTLSDCALSCLVSYSWPGNVRELENELHRAAVLAGTGPIEALHLSTRLRAGPSAASPACLLPLSERVAAFEREAIRGALELAQGNKAQAARILGLNRKTLFTKLRRLGLEGSRAI
jgi:two-component system response regulator PilR (NtrC family)